ncbi:MAG: DUF1295 domain-containing protein [Gammaproteobacteria bacterium]
MSAFFALLPFESVEERTINPATKRGIIGIVISLVLGSLIALAGNSGSVIAWGTGVFGLCILLAFAIQWIVFIPSFLAQTEHYFDLTGSLTYLSVVGFALAFSPAADLRAMIIAALIAIWATRLGTFLFRRIRKDGSDSRFDEIKPVFARFLMAWSLQGVWVSVTAAAGLAAITSQSRAELGLIGWAGIAVWLIGFGIEVIADRQKRQHRAAHPGEFIRSGLWAWSRHPNYFGEIVLWIGIAIIAFPTLSGWQYATLISPVFVYLLLTRASGVPLLEAKSDAKWGDDPEYQAYKDKTPVLMMRKPG